MDTTAYIRDVAVEILSNVPARQAGLVLIGQNIHGNTCIHEAASIGSVDCLLYLLQIANETNASARKIDQSTGEEQIFPLLAVQNTVGSTALRESRRMFIVAVAV